MRGVLRALPWLLVAASWLFAAMLWPRLTAQSLLSWFGLPLIASAVAVLLTWMRSLIHRRPNLFNHPEKERYLKLPAAFRGPVEVELRTMMDLVLLFVLVTMLLTQWLVARTALGQPSPMAVPVILVSSVLMPPILLLFLTRVSTAVETAERAWNAAGRPSA